MMNKDDQREVGKTIEQWFETPAGVAYIDRLKEYFTEAGINVSDDKVGHFLRLYAAGYVAGFVMRDDIHNGVKRENSPDIPSGFSIGSDLGDGSNG